NPLQKGAARSIAQRNRRRQPASHRGSVARVYALLVATRSIESVAQSDPNAARRTRRAELFGRRFHAARGSEGAAGSGERVCTEQRKALVASVEEVADEHEQLQFLRRLITRVEMDDGVRREAPVNVGIVVFAQRIL